MAYQLKTMPEQIAILDARATKTTLNTIIGWFRGESDSTRVNVDVLYREQSVFHQCVNLRAGAVSGMPWAIYGRGDEPIWTDEDGMVPANLQWLGDLPRLLYLWEASLCTMGAAYTLKIRRGRNAYQGLQYFNPMKVEPLVNATQGVYAFRRTLASGMETYPADDIFALFLPDPFRELGPGASEAQSAMRNARVLRAVEGFLQGYMDTGLIKKTILTVDSEGRPQEEELKRLESWWQKFLAGFKSSEAKVMSKAVKPHVIGDGLSDLNSPELNEDQRKGIAAGFGIPYSLISSSAANFATKKADQVDFYGMTVIPRANLIQRQFNRQVLSPLGLEFRFEPERLEVLQAAELEKAQTISAIVGRPVLTVNEGRALLGYDPIEEPEEAEVIVSENPQDVTAEQKAELAAWRRRVVRKGIGARFNPEKLTTKQATIVRQRLLSGEPVETAFEPPFDRGF